MAKKRNIESASVFERAGIRAIRVRAIEVLLYIITMIGACIKLLYGALLRIMFHVKRGENSCGLY